MEGIKNKILPPESVDENIYEMTDVVKNALGIEESKRAEYREYRTQVTEWEINEYLQKF